MQTDRIRGGESGTKTKSPLAFSQRALSSGDVLLSHGLSPYCHRGCSVSLPYSEILRAWPTSFDIDTATVISPSFRLSESGRRRFLPAVSSPFSDLRSTSVTTGRRRKVHMQQPVQFKIVKLVRSSAVLIAVASCLAFSSSGQ